MAFADITNTASLSPPTRADVCANCNVSAGAPRQAAGDGAAAELKDERLYGLGHERPEGDFCPICTLPIPLRMEQHSMFNICCMKRVCNGCCVAMKLRGMGGICPFCRTPAPKDNESSLAMAKKRIDAGDAEATNYLAKQYYHGILGLLEKDVNRAFELWTEAAELGSVEAHFGLGCFVYDAKQDRAGAAVHLQLAAMAGHAESRHNLGSDELDKGNYHLATKHFLISAKLGLQDSLDIIKKLFTHGHATKAQYAEALKGYGNAVEETKSHQREEAKTLFPLLGKK